MRAGIGHGGIAHASWLSFDAATAPTAPLAPPARWRDPLLPAALAWLSAAHPGRISMPLTWALSLTVTNWMVIVPVLDAVAVNGSITAMYSPPAAAKMSKSVSTWVPLISTLKVRDPAVVQYSSAKCSRTV